MSTTYFNNLLTVTGIWALGIAALRKTRKGSNTDVSGEMFDKHMSGFYKNPNIDSYKYVLGMYNRGSPLTSLGKRLKLCLGAVLANHPNYNGNTATEKSIVEWYSDNSPHLLDYSENLADYNAGAISQAELAGVLDNLWVLWFVTGDMDYPRMVQAVADDENSPEVVRGAARWSYSSNMRDVVSSSEEQVSSSNPVEEEHDDNIENLLRGGGEVALNASPSSSSSRQDTPQTTVVESTLTSEQREIRSGFTRTLRLMQTRFDPSYGPSLFNGAGDSNALYYRNHGTRSEQEEFNTLLNLVTEITEHGVENVELTREETVQRGFYMNLLGRVVTESPSMIAQIHTSMESPRQNLHPVSWYLAHGTPDQIAEFTEVYERYNNVRIGLLSSEETVQEENEIIESDTDDELYADEEYVVNRSTVVDHSHIRYPESRNSSAQR